MSGELTIVNKNHIVQRDFCLSDLGFLSNTGQLYISRMGNEEFKWVLRTRDSLLKFKTSFKNIKLGTAKINPISMSTQEKV